jgi:hypothetical protein
MKPKDGRRPATPRGICPELNLMLVVQLRGVP